MIDIDAGLLLASYLDGISKNPDESTLKSIALKSVEALINELFSMPCEYAEDGRIVDLPAPVMVLPREQHVTSHIHIVDLFLNDYHMLKYNNMAIDVNGFDWVCPYVSICKWDNDSALIFRFQGGQS
jgi:hypothetical protein